MATIRDRLEAWARTNISGSNAITRNEDAYNQMQKAMADLLDEPWVNLVIQSDMNFDTPATGKGTGDGKGKSTTAAST